MRRPGRRARAAFAAVVLLATMAAGVTVAARADAARAPANTSRDAAWILTAQLGDGALATYPDRQFVDPYTANLATVGLARAYALTRDARFSAGAWRWLTWRAAHSGGRGWTDDHRIVGGVPVSTGDVDAVDSEAATYLLALHELWTATGDRATLGGLAGSVGEAVGAITALQDTDGLTWAKPSWRVKYLMNEAEVYAGLRSGAALARVIGDTALADRATAAAARVRAGVAALWNPATGGFDWAVHGDGARVAVDWGTLYPDALEQVWAVAFGLTDPTRARLITTRFVQYHPAWAQPAAVDRIDGLPGPVGYWPQAGWSLVATGRRDLAAAGGASIRAGMDAARWAWPVSVDVVGSLIVLDGGTLPAGVR